MCCNLRLPFSLYPCPSIFHLRSLVTERQDSDGAGLVTLGSFSFNIVPEPRCDCRRHRKVEREPPRAQALCGQQTGRSFPTAEGPESCHSYELLPFWVRLPTAVHKLTITTEVAKFTFLNERNHGPLVVLAVRWRAVSQVKRIPIPYQPTRCL